MDKPFKSRTVDFFSSKLSLQDKARKKDKKVCWSRCNVRLLRVLYIRKERIKEMNVLFGDVNTAEDTISKLAHFGTTPFAVIMTIPDSLAFHKLMGIEKVSKRLHYLKSIWVNELKQVDKVEIVTPPELSCAIASFRVRDKKTSDVADVLFKEHNILTVGRALGKEGCIRVTPAVYTSADDVRKFVSAVKTL